MLFASFFIFLSMIFFVEVFFDIAFDCRLRFSCFDV